MAETGSRGGILAEIRIIADIGLGRDAHTSDRPERGARGDDDLVSRYITDTDDVFERLNVESGLVQLVECHNSHSFGSVVCLVKLECRYLHA